VFVNLAGLRDGEHRRSLRWLTSPQLRLGLDSPPRERRRSLALGFHEVYKRILSGPYLCRPLAPVIIPALAGIQAE